MMILVTGSSKCGKSRFAESLFDAVSVPKYYLATMQPYGEEAHSAIEQHRKMRADKGFLTAEQYTDIDRAEIPAGSAVLLECMGNLLANEMFRGGQMNDCTDKIVFDILRMSQRMNLLVIVTNQVGSDGLDYDAGTAAYIAALGIINQKIAENADKVIECVYGIPVTVKR
ncbi:MAG: bifunctional adenosylcobinamide kinase/adenosylcobinamide-phosphate guanylyltransferase [Oscillospiraceae bacterium]|nr:bifunctional adenosylcobinamide kinase/adenosylcobinamide-phosphate guanylyltransferase [Oscillospiraceae bacterium]